MRGLTWVIHVVEVPHDCHICVVIPCDVKCMLGSHLRNAHLNDLVQQFSIQIRLAKLLACSSALRDELLTRLRLTLSALESLEVVGSI